MVAGLGLGLLTSAPSMLAAHALAGRELRVITDSESPSARQLLQLLRQRYPQLIADAPQAPSDPRRATPIHVAIGSQALQKALASDIKGPIISLMVSSQAYRQALGMGLPGYKDRRHVTGVFADASPAAQMQLIKGLFGDLPKVGVLLSEATAFLDKPLHQAAAHAGLTLLTERVNAPSDAVRTLARLRDTEVLLAVPDNTLYTPDTLRAILESTYRRGMPIIGFSAATVAAGTLAAAYCTLEDMAADLALLLDDIGAGTVPEARFPQYWRVAINDSVARSLGVPIDDKTRLLGHQPGGRNTP